MERVKMRAVPVGPDSMLIVQRWPESESTWGLSRWILAMRDASGQRDVAELATAEAIILRDALTELIGPEGDDA